MTTEGQKMFENDYAEGSLEWHAWGLGNEYARDTKKYGSMAMNPGRDGIVLATWQAVMGKTYGIEDITAEEREENDEDIAAAWLSGYWAYWMNERRDEQTSMKTFRLEITLGNDAMQTFEDLRDALMIRVADFVSVDPGDFGIIRDENGNTVGSWRIDE